MSSIGGPGFRKAAEEIQAFAIQKRALESANQNAERIITAINQSDLQPAEHPNLGKQLDVKA